MSKNYHSDMPMPKLHQDTISLILSEVHQSIIKFNFFNLSKLNYN